MKWGRTGLFLSTKHSYGLCLSASHWTQRPHSFPLQECHLSLCSEILLTRAGLLCAEPSLSERPWHAYDLTHLKKKIIESYLVCLKPVVFQLGLSKTSPGFLVEQISSIYSGILECLLPYLLFQMTSYNAGAALPCLLMGGTVARTTAASVCRWKDFQ